MEYQARRFHSIASAGFLLHGPGAYVWGREGDREFLILALPGRRYVQLFPRRQLGCDGREHWMRCGLPGERYGGDRDRVAFDGSIESQGCHVRLRDGILAVL